MRVAAPRHATSWPPSPSTSSAGNRHPPTEVRSPPHISPPHVREDPHDRTVPPPRVGRCPRRVDRARLGGRLRPSGPAQRGPRPDQDRVAGLAERHLQGGRRRPPRRFPALPRHPRQQARRPRGAGHHRRRSEEHTSELQSRENLVCRLLLEKKKKKKKKYIVNEKKKKKIKI